MFDQYFIHYLLNKGALTHQQTYEVLKYERSVRVRLGLLAMNAGLMTAAQVEEVHNLQRSRDKQFGALAVEKGYLSDGQLAGLLETQGQGHLKVMQAVVDKGYLSLEQLANHLAAFHRENGLAEGEGKSSQPVDTDKIIRLLVDFTAAGSMAATYHSYISLLFRNIVRFLDDNPVIIWPSPPQDSNLQYWVARQTMAGDVNISTALAMDASVLLEVASRFSGETLRQVDELATDSVAEFLNVHNGVFGGNLSELGIAVDLQPQQISETVDRDAETGYRVSIGLSFGRIDVLLS
jgi:hypothetical protein